MSTKIIRTRVSNSKVRYVVELSQKIDDQIENVYVLLDDSIALLNETQHEAQLRELKEEELRRKSREMIDGLQAIRNGIIDFEISEREASDFSLFLMTLAERIRRYFGF